MLKIFWIYGLICVDSFNGRVAADDARSDDRNVVVCRIEECGDWPRNDEEQLEAADDVDPLLVR